MRQLVLAFTKKETPREQSYQMKVFGRDWHCMWHAFCVFGAVLWKPLLGVVLGGPSKVGTLEASSFGPWQKEKPGAPFKTW